MRNPLWKSLQPTNHQTEMKTKEFRGQGIWGIHLKYQLFQLLNIKCLLFYIKNIDVRGKK